MTTEGVEQKVRDFILREFLPGEDPEELQADTPLLSTGILDSIATLKLVSYLESEFDIGIEAHEADAQNMNTVGQITALVSSKL